MRAWSMDVRHGWRVLLRNPGPAVGAALCLAVGIGGTTSVFSVADAVLLRPFPFRDEGRLALLWQRDAHGNATVEVSYPNFLDWRRESHGFQELAAMGSVNWSCRLTGRGEPASLPCAAVSANFFSTLGVQALLGRTFRLEEDGAGAARVAVLSHRLWRDRFGADPALVGQTLTLNGLPFSVVGVMPGEFDFPRGALLWTPVGPELAAVSRKYALDSRAERGLGVLFVVGRVRPDVPFERAREELKGIVRRLALADWGTEDADVVLTPLVDSILGRTRAALWALCGAAGLVLLLAVSNVASLLLALGIDRRREAAVRLALGASTRRVVRQLLTEGSLLVALGGAGGLFLAFGATRALVALSPGDVPRLEHVAVDPRVLAFTLLVSILATLLVGLAPALQAATVAPLASLREGGRSVSLGAGSRRLGDALSVAQLALAVVLLVGGGLMARSFWRLRHVDPGFDPTGLLAVNVALPDSDYPDLLRKTALHEALLSRVRSLPGVAAAGAVYRRPLLGEIGSDVGVRPEGAASGDRRPFANAEVVTPGTFRAMGIPLRRGRDFTDRDAADAQPVAIVSEGLARLLWPGQDPIGRRLLTETVSSRDAPPKTVVGVVGDVRYRGLQTARPDLYTPLRQSTDPVNDLMVRAGPDPMALAPAIRREVHALDGSLVVEVYGMDRVVARELAPWRFDMIVLGALGAIGLVLATVGVYAVVSYGVARRTHEIGVRMALGAGRRDVMRPVVGHGLLLAVWGLGIGAAAALGAARLTASLLFGVSAHDAPTFLGVSLLLGGVAALAAWLPARRAAAVDPVTALRHE
ncbi:MAG TPA: ABC transporter permease [Vicinamibacteria bacterium]|nr:ABC transporter permease [Vicinamibacteria bacterium]